MKLIPDSLKIPAIGETENVSDPIVMVKLFHPCGSWSWYVTEFNQEEGLCFGYVDGAEFELGYFSLDELERVKMMGLGVKRDLCFMPMRSSELKRILNKES